MSIPSSNDPYKKSKVDPKQTKIFRTLDNITDDSNKSSTNSYSNNSLWQRYPWLKKVLIGGGVAVGLVFLLVASLVIAVLSGKFGELPNAEALKNIQNPTASEVLSSDGTVLGKYYFQNRTIIPYTKISPNLTNALVATEDQRFFAHQGVDFLSLLRVFIKTLLMGDESSGGGSTISQQLAKNLFPRQDYGWLSMPVNKTREAIIASRLENNYTKEQVLGLYLNTVPFGENVYGVESASRRFFGKSASGVAIEEAAVLVGMLKANTTYNPRRNPEAAKKRRNVVLGQMVKNGKLTQKDYNDLQNKPIQLNYSRDSSDDGLAPHLREKLRLEVQQWLKDNPKPDGTSYNLYTDGLRIETTIDARMQQYAEEAMKEHMIKLQKSFDDHWKGKKPWGNSTDIINTAKKQSDRYRVLKDAGLSEAAIDANFKKVVPMKVFSWNGTVEKNMSPLDSIQYYLMFLNAGLIAADAFTGEVKAYVGSISHQYFKFDYANARRQVGSTFKPVVYAAALDNGIEPCKFYANQLRTYTNYQNWTPKNSHDEYGGYYSMKGALAQSMNTISAEILFETGVENVVLKADQMGIETPIPKLPAIALGATEVPLKEMVSAYATIDNGGYYTPLVYLKSIKDKTGKTIADFSPKDYRSRGQVLRSETAHYLTSIMEAVVDSGTARRLRTEYKLTNAIAGKTGTTQDHGDGWFIGYTPNIVCGVWVGGFNKQICFRTIALGQGATMALPIWGGFMQKVSKDLKFWKENSKRFTSLTEAETQALSCPMYVDNLYDINTNATSDESIVEPIDGSIAQDNSTTSDEPNNNTPIFQRPRSRPQNQPPNTFSEAPNNNATPSHEQPVRVKVKSKSGVKAPEQQNPPPATPEPKAKKGLFGKLRDILENN